MSEAKSPVVSFDDEPLILVDADDHILGHKSKAECHDGDGLLHRAFSVFLFDADNNILLQQRSAQKRLWPLFWANSCCSHPRRGETMDNAAVRRTREELALSASLSYLFKFEYQAHYAGLGSEHELCSVYVGRAQGTPAFNRLEIAATKRLTPAALDNELRDNPSLYTPWLHLEWPRLRGEFWAQIEALPTH